MAYQGGDEPQLLSDLRTALRRWHRPTLGDAALVDGLADVDGRLAADLGLTRSNALRQSVRAALALLRDKGRAEEADLMERRYLRGESVTWLTETYSLSERSIYHRLNKAHVALAHALWTLDQAEAEAPPGSPLVAESSRTLSRARHLPPQTGTPLFGMDEVLPQLLDYLNDHGGHWVISLDGMAGLGKTALAREAAGRLAETDRFADIAWVTVKRLSYTLRGPQQSNLPALTCEQVLDTIANQLGGIDLDSLPLPAKRDRVREILYAGSCLVVLDNLETAVACGTWPDWFWSMADPSKFLLTSRRWLQSDVGQCATLKGKDGTEVMNWPAPEVLVTMSGALQILESHAPEVLVVEVVSEFYQGPSLQDHRSSHPLPGFVQVKTERLETGPLWNLESDGHLQKVLAESGLVPGSPKRILLFDNIQLACGTAQSRFDASARLLSVLYYFGFSHAAIILDPTIHPSFPDEFAARQPEVVRRLVSRPLPSEAGPSQGGASAQGRWVPKHRDHLVSYETMAQLLAGRLGPYRLLDSRSAEEYAGIFTGYDYIPLAGRIPTAESVVNGDYQVSAAEGLEAVLGRLADTLARKGIDHKDRIVWYCGTGWRASRMCALTRALGYGNVAVYDGGWNEWHRRHPKDGSERPSGIDVWGSPDQARGWKV